ncbi:MAG: hypothetical protein QOG87_174 [Actinomycetota bacterium]
MVATPARAGGGGCHGVATEGSGLDVRISQACFSPTVLRVPVGAKVTFTNDDEMLHAISGTTMGYDELSGGGSAERSFDRPGIHPYMCHLHPSMTGVVIVGDGAPVEPVDAVGLVPAAVRSPASDDGSDATVMVALGAVAAAAGLAGGFLLQKRRAARA